MNAPKIWKLFPVMLVCCAVSMVHAKLPPPSDEAKAKAEEAKQKAADAAKKQAELLGKAQDRAVERYKKVKGGGEAGKAASAATPMAKKQ